MTGLVAGHPLPAMLAAGDDPGLAAWRDELPRMVQGLLTRWELEASAPFSPGGTSAWVAPVHDVDGMERVLKVAWAHEESRDEAAGMVAWQGRGAARVHRSERHGETAALLLDRVHPGTPLAAMLTWPERDEVIATVARGLWRPPSELLSSDMADAGFEDADLLGADISGADAATGFRPLSQMCAWWADSAQQRADDGHSPLPRGLVDHGLQLFRELPAQWDGEAVLLATDLHPGNVLSSAGGSGAVDGSVEDGSGRHWVLIDPKPYVGDPHYDVLQHMFNDPDRLRAQPDPFADRMAQLAGLDPHRVRQWLLARCVQEAGVLDAAAEAALMLAADGVE